MKKNFRFFLLLFTLTSVLFSVPVQKEVTTNSIGVAAGYVSGFGLSYRRWFTEKQGFQVTFTPVYTQKKSEGTKYINVSLGLLGLTKLHSGDFTTLFLYYGAHYWKYEDTRIEQRYYYTSDPYYSSYYRDTLVSTKNELLQFGAGPGVEFHLGRISFNIMVGLRGGYDIITTDQMIKPTVETALYYGF